MGKRFFFFLSNKQALLVAVWKVKQVLHGHKGVAESFCGGDPLLRIDQQHLLQQAHKLPTVGLLREQVTTFQIHHQVHLQDILPSLLHAHISVTVGTYQRGNAETKEELLAMLFTASTISKSLWFFSHHLASSISNE